MTFLAVKTEDGRMKGKISFYCRVLGGSWQGFCKYLVIRDHPWRYQKLADGMRAICDEDEYNDTYRRMRMRQALLSKTSRRSNDPQ